MNNRKTTTRAFLSALFPQLAVIVIFFFVMQFGAEDLAYEFIKTEKLAYWEYDQVFSMFGRQSLFGILMLFACSWAFIGGARRTSHDGESYRSSMQLTMFASVIASIGLMMTIFVNKVFVFFDSYRKEEFDFGWILSDMVSRPSFIGDLALIAVLLAGGGYILYKARVVKADKAKVAAISLVSVILSAVIGTIILFGYGWRYN